uniref:Putative ovule protein n=1 Tax=Solanum chacoense TaxID=4108 RepID=A0A0V0GPE5_SOLCH
MEKGRRVDSLSTESRTVHESASESSEASTITGVSVLCVPLCCHWFLPWNSFHSKAPIFITIEAKLENR